MARTKPKSPDVSKLHIRWMIRRDMPEVLGIESASFDEPWGEEDFLRCLRGRSVIGMVAENGEVVVGFMIYELNTEYLTLHSLAVHPDWRRMAVGRRMIDKLVSKLSQHRRTRIVATIHEGYLSGQLFLRACAFRCVRVERSCFGDESGYVMEYRFTAEKAVEIPAPKM